MEAVIYGFFTYEKWCHAFWSLHMLVLVFIVVVVVVMSDKNLIITR